MALMAPVTMTILIPPMNVVLQKERFLQTLITSITTLMAMVTLISMVILVSMTTVNMTIQKSLIT